MSHLWGLLLKECIWAKNKSYYKLGTNHPIKNDVYTCLRREVEEECGMEITFIVDENQRVDYKNNNDTSTLILPFCVTQMIEGPFIGLIFLCQAEGEPILLTNESKDARWVDIDKVKGLVNNSPEQLYTAFLAPIKKYLNYIYNHLDQMKFI